MGELRCVERTLLAMAALWMSGCSGGGADEAAPPAPGATISSFSSQRTVQYIGEPVEFLAHFSGGAGRIDPGAISVSSGQPVTAASITQATTYRLTVSNGAESVTRDLTVPVRYRERLRAVDAPFAREGHVAVELQDGRVLFIGGSSGGGGMMPLTNYLFDPDAETFSEFGALIDPRYNHMALVLHNGDVLVVGGDVQLPDTREAEIIDTRTGVAAPTGAPHRNRQVATATRLLDGRVLLAGGFAHGLEFTAEIYDPAASEFTLVPNELVYGRLGHSADLLDDGRVLLHGGFGVNGQPIPPEVFDPTTNAFSPLAPQDADVRAFHMTVAMAGGAVLLGGENAIAVPTSATLRLDLATGQYQPLAPLLTPRTHLAAAALVDGRILIGGGYTNTIAQSTNDTEVVSVEQNTRAPGPDMTSGRTNHTMTALRNGKVLIFGGLDPTQNVLSSAELFE